MLPQLFIQTPLLESVSLSEVLSTERKTPSVCWVKMDALQPSGSFKMRGVSHHVLALVKRGATRLVTSSGGNAGMAVAVAGRKLGIPVEVIVPSSTPAYMREKIQKEGAQVVVFGSVWDEANEEAKRRSEAPGAALVHPFDHPELWTGHASLITEIKQQLRDNGETRPPMCVVTVAGGGGLMCGVLEGLAKVGWEDVPVVVCETRGAESLHASLQKGEQVTLPGISSIARSLGARRVADEAFRLAKSRPVVSLVVSDEAAVSACWRFLESHRVAVEPACGAGLAAIYNWRELDVESRLSKFGLRDGPVVFIACGGNMVVLERPRL